MTDIELEIQKARIDLAAIHRIACELGWQESVVNHMTCMVLGRNNVYLIIPYGVHWDEVRASDFLVVDFDGRVVSGQGEPEISAISAWATA